MRVTPAVKKILSSYESENPGVKSKLARLMMQGKLAGTGKLVIYGSIVGRNAFQRPKADALALPGRIVDVHRGEA